MAMTLRGRLGYGIAMLIAVSLAIAALGVSGAARMHQDFGAVQRSYQQMRDVYEIGLHVAQARKLAAGGSDRQAEARQEIDVALTHLELTASIPQKLPAESIPGWIGDSLQSMRALHTDLEAAKVELATSSTHALDAAVARVAAIATEVQRELEARQRHVASARRRTAWTIAAASGWLILTAALIGVRQYRSITRPVDQLGAALRRFAAGDLNARVQMSADREFMELASEFNRMAGELAGFQHELEGKVAAKSRELVRSERLATVGYMAAGVAHEINNPLGIIAAYAERALQQMRRSMNGDPSAAGGINALQVISEEAFRCKAITDRLLTLSRPGSPTRGPFSLRALSQEVISTLRGLPQWRHVDLNLDCKGKGNDTFIATVNDGEIKQVLLNLLVNALEAVPERGGVVRLDLSREGSAIQVAVEDNGRGIDEGSLDHVFEPFFTRKRSTDGARAGTGLGLSVCQAIVDAHGGRIFATSGGAGWGSRFTVLIPVVPPAAALARPMEIENG